MELMEMLSPHDMPVAREKRLTRDAPASGAPLSKKPRSDMTRKSTKSNMDAKYQKAYEEAVRKHPFRDNADHVVDFHSSTVFRDAKGTICAIFLPKALPEFAASMATSVLESAAVRTSLRAPAFGGIAPLSGIAGYFDYRGSPVELKCRKTSFTYEHIKRWPEVFPMIDYVSSIYKEVLPRHWAIQHSAVPELVRIHNSPFSTLTVNQRFRTASHTDTGDFDEGFGVLAVLNGNYKGLHLAIDDHKVCFNMRPTDVLLFNTHFFHSNTELETIDPNDGNWSRLSCVFYFRTMLGRPSCLAEYRRRLGINTHAAITAEHLDKLMEQTHPAEVTNKLAPVHPVPFTPFVCAAYACSFRGAATSKLLQLHRLSCENVALQEELFGEPLAVSDGLLPRKPEELTISLDSASLPVTFAGGFNVSESSIKFFQKRRQCFDKKNLKKKFTKELVEMWDQCLKLWLILVKEDWNRQNGRLPGRKRFTWNNTSLMSSAFFDLCDVASQMVDDMLVDEGDMNDEQNFWGIFAAFLDDACVKKIGMPPHAMGMQKLNVKLKDYTFGGTRYLKDLPPEDQMRRLLRRQKIEDARRYGTKLSSAQSSEWLHNDTFDYQSEDAPVEYKKNGWIEPEENSRQFRSFVLEQLTDVCKDTDSTDVLVVLPRPAASKKPVSTIPQSQEADRLMKNPAAQRLLLFKKDATSERVRNKTPHVESHGRVRIVTIYSDDDVGESVYDFVIMRHVLASVGVCDAVRSLKQWTSRARYCTFVVEVDVLDRRTYVLRKAVRDEYNRVASDCLKELYSAANCRSAIDLLTTPIIISSIKESGNVFESRFKFSGSPLNTVAFVVRRPEPKLAGDEHEIPLEPEALHV